MRSPFTVQVSGLKEWQRDVRRAEGDTREGSRALRTAHKEIAEIVADSARSKAARFQRSGRFMRSIVAQGTTRGAYVKGGSPGRAPHFGPINFGHPARNIKAQEVLYSSLAEHSDDVSERWEELVKDIESLLVGMSAGGII